MTLQSTYADTESHRPRQRRREANDEFVRLARHFAEDDRLLVEQVFGHGQSVAEVARLVKTPARSLRRRVRRLHERSRDPVFRFVVARWELLPAEAQRVARPVVLEGFSLREAAARIGKTLHFVRRQMQVIETLRRLY